MCNEDLLINDETWDDVLEFTYIAESAINYLNNNKIQIVDIGIKKVIESNPSYISMFELKKDNFKDSIIKTRGHFSYIMKEIKNQGQVNFEEYDEDSVKELPPKAYRDFYKYISEYICTIKEDKYLKEKLKIYFDGFAKGYP